MSDRVIQEYHDSAGRTRQSLHSYQSLWMSHWTGSSCNTAPQEQNQLSRPFGDDEDGHDTKQHHLLSGAGIASDISGSAKGLKEVKARTFELINKSPAMSSRNLRNERLGFQDSPMGNLSQKSGSNSVLKYGQDTNNMQLLNRQFAQNFEHGNTGLCTSQSHFPSILAVAPPATETSSRECHFQHQSVSQNPKELVKSHMIFGSSFAFSRSSQDDFTGTASHVLPQGFNHGECRFDSGRSAVPSFVCRQEEVNQLRSILASKKHLSDTNLTILEQEKFNYHSHSAFSAGEKKIDKCSTSGKSVIPYLRKDNDSSLIINDTSTRNNHSPVFCEEQFQRMQNHSSIKLFPSWSSPPELNKLEKLHRGRCLQTKSDSAHDVKTVRICTSVDSVEGLTGSSPRISQTTHSLLVTKKTDVNLCKENRIFRESRVLGQLKENIFSELHGFAQPCGHGQRGVKLQLLGSSTDSEGKENVQDVNVFEVVSKNESSAETDTMDVDNFKENHLSGVNSSPSNKDVMMDPDLPPHDAIASAREEVRQRRPIPELPDINVELPALPAAASSKDNAESSTSRTQSLDMDLLLHAERPSNPTSNHFPDVHLGPKSSSRWIKRLKLMDPDLQPHDAIASAGVEVRHRRPIPELPDINVELPSLPAAASSKDNAEPSTSKTQSLDMDLLLHAEQPSNPKSNHCPDGRLGPESSSRWIKRLKLSASGSFSIGTKSLNLGEASSHEKVNTVFSKIMKGRITDSELILGKHAGKELMVLDQTTTSVRNGKSSSVDNREKGDDISLSHSWIQRWRRNRAATPQKRLEADVVCDPQSSKVTLEDFQKKQFPSIAAMALMGKAMNGFQQCEFQNRGSFIVWNTKGL